MSPKVLPKLPFPMYLPTVWGLAKIGTPEKLRSPNRNKGAPKGYPECRTPLYNP